MTRLEEITQGVRLSGILPDTVVTVIGTVWIGAAAVELTYKTEQGKLGQELVYRNRESDIEIVKNDNRKFDADSEKFRLVSESLRIKLAYLFDPLMAMNTSQIEPLPHQITAVYETMLNQHPLRFLLADDPGAGKTVMTGLYIKESAARGELKRCLIVCPGNLAEQWQDEMNTKFQLPFTVMTNDNFEYARTGNWFNENPLAICRLDKLSRNEDIQAKLKVSDWDLIVCDEAHKLSAHLFGSKTGYSKRYRLGQILSGITRHFLLLTATPHSGKEADFQLFMALLDEDRFAKVHQGEVEKIDASDLMRRMVKEDLLKFDGRPLFPERRAYTTAYQLSPQEIELYESVTNYVRDEFNRADMLLNGGQKTTVGFALTVLQRRLASSPEAIYQSLKRRRERLEKMFAENGRPLPLNAIVLDSETDDDDISEQDEEQIADLSTAAKNLTELKTEIETLKTLEQVAFQLRQSNTDKKWEELSKLLQTQSELFDTDGNRHKLIIFTEHRDTLNYLQQKIASLLGKSNAVVVIHGAMNRETRKLAELQFTQDKDAVVLVATDAAGEGINLQQAHLLINYDLPWNPNRLEQRFGRIHRIGQSKVCHCWNLVAAGTREGDVFQRLLHKLEQERQALGGKVFDVLGQLVFNEKPLSKLLLEAVRYGDDPQVRSRMNQVVDNALDQEKIQQLLDDYALTHDSINTSKVREIREMMERAEARKLQPHFIAAFFIEAFMQLGGKIHQKEANRCDTPRQYKNALVFLAPDERRLDELSANVKKYLAWKSIKDDTTLNLDRFQEKQIRTKFDGADERVTAQIPETYIWLLIPEQQDPQGEITWAETRLQNGETMLLMSVLKRLKQEEWLLTQLGNVRLRQELDRIPLWQGDAVPIKQLAEYFASYIYLPRLQNPNVLVGAIRNGVMSITWQESFAYAQSFDETKQRYLGLVAAKALPALTADDAGLLVKPEIAQKQLEADAASQPPPAVPSANTAETAGIQPATAPELPAVQKKQLTRFFASAKLDRVRFIHSLNQVYEEVVNHLSAAEDLELTLEIQARFPKGAPEKLQHIIEENCRTLKFKDFGFEED